uniref:Hint domain-containing protein n=1 Tax=Roseicyclus sp. TaxID=1914329 RepID=UPI003F6C90F6
RDLVVTADHALLVEGLLVNASVLVNGTTITEVADLPERVTVYHIETEDHDIILAEGAPVETYVDYAGRRAFDNYAEYLALYGEDRVISEMAYPRISSARMLPAALKAKLGITRAA